jgi:hypothetical protein
MKKERFSTLMVFAQETTTGFTGLLVGEELCAANAGCAR